MWISHSPKVGDNLCHTCSWKRNLHLHWNLYIFFSPSDGLIVFVELFQVTMGWGNWAPICKAIGIKLDKPKGNVIGKLGSTVWVYEVLSKALWKINGQRVNLKL